MDMSLRHRSRFIRRGRRSRLGSIARAAIRVQICHEIIEVIDRGSSSLLWFS